MEIKKTVFTICFEVQSEGGYLVKPGWDYLGKPCDFFLRFWDMNGFKVSYLVSLQGTGEEKNKPGRTLSLHQEISFTKRRLDWKR